MLLLVIGTSRRTKSWDEKAKLQTTFVWLSLYKQNHNVEVLVIIAKTGFCMHNSGFNIASWRDDLELNRPLLISSNIEWLAREMCCPENKAANRRP